MEEGLNRQMGAMKGQLDENARDKDELLRLKNQLQEEVTRLRAMVADLQGQVGVTKSTQQASNTFLNS